MKDSRFAVPSWLDVSRETLDRLQAFVEMTVAWNKSINLVANADPDLLWSRHILDSAQIFDLLPGRTQSWADLGSGGGFPGLVLAILATEKSPALSFTLVESDKRKAVFLSEVSRRLDLKAIALPKRIESIPPLNADVVSARALAPLSTLLDYGRRHMSAGGKLIFPKGARAVEEIQAARQKWQFSLVEHASRTDENAVILEITELRHA
jgi:16S rRNA (guanine527-N7)-methyltransferase